MPIKKLDESSKKFENAKRELVQRLTQIGIPVARILPESSLTLIMVEMIMTHDEFKRLSHKIIEEGGSIRKFDRYNKSQYLYTVLFHADGNPPGLNSTVLIKSLGESGTVVFIGETYRVDLGDGHIVNVEVDDVLPIDDSSL